MLITRHPFERLVSVFRDRFAKFDSKVYLEHGIKILNVSDEEVNRKVNKTNGLSVSFKPETQIFEQVKSPLSRSQDLEHSTLWLLSPKPEVS